MMTMDDVGSRRRVDGAVLTDTRPGTDDPGEPQARFAEPPEAPARRSGPSSRPKLFLYAADAAAVLIAAALAAMFAARSGAETGENPWQLFWVTAATVPVWLAMFSNQRLYNTRFIARRIDEIRRIVNAAFVGVLAVSAVAGFVRILPPRSGLVMLFVFACISVSVEREAARRLFTRLRTNGRMTRYVVVAGANPEGQEIAAMLQSTKWLGYTVVGFVDDSETAAREPVPGLALLGRVSDLPAILSRYPSASVIVASTGVDSSVTNRMARDLLDRGIHVELSSTLRDISSQRLTVRPLGRFPVVYVEPVTRDGWRAGAKRAFDIAIAAVALVLTSPLVLVAAIAIKLDSKGPVLFRQVRVGRNSEPFGVLKLRTMVTNAEALLPDLIDLNEADGPLFKMANDPRITRIGRILRATSIDELPQLWNVLRGEMSLVGPRPALPHETEEWDALLVQRLRVKPGITGMWQVSGRSDTSFEDYTRLDLYYVDNWTLTTDLAILAKTVPVVLMRQGAR